MDIQALVNIVLEAEPSDPQHVVNVDWVEKYVLGKIKAPVRLVSTMPLAGTYAAGELTLAAAGHLSIDNVQVANGDRVLLVGQTGANATQNGVYVITDEGNGGPAELTRADDFNASDKIYSGVAITVREGATNASTTWRLITEGTIILDTTALEFIPVAPIAAASKFADDIVGDNTETEFEITHNLQTTDVSVTIKNMANNAIVWAGIEVDDANNVTISFADPPTPAQHYRVTVMG